MRDIVLQNVRQSMFILMLLVLTCPSEVLGSGLPNTTKTPYIKSNLEIFLLPIEHEVPRLLRINGVLLTISPDNVGVMSIALTPGENVIELVEDDSTREAGQLPAKVHVLFEPLLRTAQNRLLYVDSVSRSVEGTIVIDLDQRVVLGLLEGQHIRGISPDGKEIYMDDRTVISTETHQAIGRLAFSEKIPINGFLVSPDGRVLYSRREVLDWESGIVIKELPADITTGSSFARAPIPGGPAITNNGRRIYFDERVRFINTRGNRAMSTDMVGHFMSDIAVSPNQRYVLVSEYAFARGKLDIYQRNSWEKVAEITGIGDFSGEIVFSNDGKFVIVGSSGNPLSGNGGLTVANLRSLKRTSQVVIPLADNLAISEGDEIYVSSGRAAGVDVFQLHENGELELSGSIALGVNRSVVSSGRPRNDNIRKLIYRKRID